MKSKRNRNEMKIICFADLLGGQRTERENGQMGLKSSMKNKLSWQVVGHCDVALWSRWCHLFGLIQFILLAKLLPSNLKVLRLNSVKSNRHSEKTSTHTQRQSKQMLEQSMKMTLLRLFSRRRRRSWCRCRLWLKSIPYQQRVLKIK